MKLSQLYFQNIKFLFVGTEEIYSLLKVDPDFTLIEFYETNEDKESNHMTREKENSK